MRRGARCVISYNKPSRGWSEESSRRRMVYGLEMESVSTILPPRTNIPRVLQQRSRLYFKCQPCLGARARTSSCEHCKRCKRRRRRRLLGDVCKMYIVFDMTFLAAKYRAFSRRAARQATFTRNASARARESGRNVKRKYIY